MTTWGDIASQLLAAAEASGVSVARTLVAPGPLFSRDCRLLAVVMLRPDIRPVTREFPGTCAVVPTHTFEVVFAADCVPPLADDGSPPSESDVTAWSVAFLDDCGKVYDALTDAATSGAIAGGCENVSLGTGEMRGPLGGMSSMVVPVTVAVYDEGME